MPINNIVSQGAIALPKLAELAVGQLYRSLGFIQNTFVWRTTAAVQNGGTWNIPVLGTFGSNVRAPGDSVVQQSPVPTVRSINIIERESTFPVDPTWEDSESGTNYILQYLTNAVNAVARDVTRDLLSILAQEPGVSFTGTLGATLVKADFDSARKILTDNELPEDNRYAILSTDQMSNLVNIPEFSRVDANGIPGVFSDGVVRRVAGFAALETPYVYSPLAGQHIGLAVHAPSVYSVFPMQGSFNKGSAEKSETELDGIRIALLREYLPGYNGAYQITVSSRFGFRLGRQEALVHLRGI